MKSKKLPLSKYRGHDSRDMVDHISNLPDCILHHVLSFMPSNEVVKTSILSTRWKNLWASVPSIDIDDALLYPRVVDDRHPSKVTSFMNFVEKVLRARDASNLKKFCLKCRISSDALQVHSWISDAIKHNVQELDLSLVDQAPSVIPWSVFDNTSLTSLKLEIEWIQVPSHVSFPCLKTLHLTCVGFLNDDDPKKLFLACPVLEKLVLSECWWIQLDNIVISNSSLKSLTMHDHLYFEPLDDFNGCKVNIDATNLTYFEYVGHLSNEILLHNIPSVVEAYIHIPLPEERQDEVACRAINLLKQLRYVASLGISNCTMEVIDKLAYILNGIYRTRLFVQSCHTDFCVCVLSFHAKSLICTDMPLHFPLFPNLIHLTLTTEIESYTLGALMDLFHFCPILQSLCLSEGFELSMDLGENDRIWLLIPICVSNCLKTVTFKNFHANSSEICFIKHIWKSAHVLERMNICWSKTQLGDLKKETEVVKELVKTERSSTVCVVKFS